MPGNLRSTCESYRALRDLVEREPRGGPAREVRRGRAQEVVRQRHGRRLIPNAHLLPQTTAWAAQEREKEESGGTGADFLIKWAVGRMKK